MALSLDQIRSRADAVAQGFGLEIVELDFQGTSKLRTLRVFLEKNAEGRAAMIAAAQAEGADPLPSGVPVESLSGVTHEDCARFAEDFGTVLDVEDLIPGADYTLEVSSPGLDRKLSTPRDFERFTGSLIALQTTAPINGNRHWRGRLRSFSDGTLALDLSAIRQKGKARKAAPAEEVVQIPLAEVSKANLLAEI